MGQPIKHKSKVQTLFWIAIVSSWLTILFFLFIPIGLLFWLAVLIYLFVKRAKLKWFLLLCSSWTVIPFISFISATKDYFQGNATIESFGMPDQEFYNLDPDLRLWNSSSGCIVLGYEPFTQLPNNLAIKFWTRTLGIQNGTYKGIYPTKEQSREIIKMGRQMNLAKVADTIYMSNEKEILFIVSAKSIGVDALEKVNSAKAFLLNNECWLIQPNGDTTNKVIMLADKTSGIVFARYYNLQTP